MKKIFLPIVALVAVCIFCSIASSSSGDMITLYSYQSTRGDAVFSKIVPNNNYGAIEDIHIYAWTQSNTVNVNRVLLDFNTEPIAQNTKICRAYLNLYYNTTTTYDKGLGGIGNQGTSDFIIQQVSSNWNETTVTWATQPGVYDSEITIEKKMNAHANYLKLDVTDLVQAMINRPVNERFGLRLKLAKEAPYNIYFFASGNHPDLALRPSLHIQL